MEKSGKSSKLVKIVLIIVVTIIGIILVVFFSAKKAEAPVKLPFASKTIEYEGYTFSLPESWKIEENVKGEGMAVCSRNEDNIHETVSMIIINPTQYNGETQKFVDIREPALKKEGKEFEKKETGNAVTLITRWSEKTAGIDVKYSNCEIIFDNGILMLTALNTGAEMEPDFDTVIEYIISTAQKIK